MKFRTIALVVLMIAGAIAAWELARPAGPYRVVESPEVRERQMDVTPESPTLVELVDPESAAAEERRLEALERDRIDYPERVAAGPPTVVEEEELSPEEEEDERTDFDDFIESFVETSWVRGRLLAESGGFELSALAVRKGIVVELSSHDTPGLSMQADLEFVEEADGTRSIDFKFEEVPLGRYELSVSSLGGERWAPQTRDVQPPEEGIELMRYDLDATGEVKFRVTNAETGKAVTGYRLRTVRTTHSDENGVFLHTGPLDPSRVPVQGSVEWTVDAAGFAPAFGSDANFYFEGKRRICEVLLTPGWSTRFLVLGTEARASDGEPVTVALGGAEVSLDGTVIGLTDANGVLVCRRAEEPSLIEVRHGDIVVRGDSNGVVEGRTASQRGNVSVILMRSAETPVKD